MTTNGQWAKSDRQWNNKIEKEWERERERGEKNSSMWIIEWIFYYYYYIELNMEQIELLSVNGLSFNFYIFKQ